ncbi:hypothetical protein AC578_5015 [Pseudocercospora eumusae]|uniref:Mid2 domain-containing protein n=1 Tax=Pseudocercospora eumusae TaxID=321146 RepID=A0A139GWZ9_9PEZI|nr:hypothetical protein AC578_5015 [Pseudocercospora eumusae]
MRLLLLWKAIVALTSVAEAQQLAFITPNGGDPTQYTEGQQIQIRWTTPFHLTNLEVWQGPRQDGSYGMHTLKCCVAVSQQFRIQQIPRLVANPTPAKAQPDTPAKAQANATTHATSSESSGVSHQAEIGAALGIGLAGAVAIMICCVLWLRKKYLYKKYLDKQGLKDAQQHKLGYARQVPTELDEKLQYNLYQSSVRASFTTTGTAASGKAPSYFDPFEFEDEDGKIREGWYSLWGDGRPSRMSSAPRGKSLMSKSRLAKPEPAFF